ncbi:MAG: CinA family protein [Coprococcus catus]
MTYCNEAKVMQGVPADTIDRYGSFQGNSRGNGSSLCETYQVDIGIGVTGTMGNIDPANPDASVPGQVYFAIVINGDMKSDQIELASAADKTDLQTGSCKGDSGCIGVEGEIRRPDESGETESE